MFSLLVLYLVHRIGRNSSFSSLEKSSKNIYPRFTPEQLGMHASWILIWNIIENSCLCLIFFLLNIQSQLRTLDLIAYCGYKYVGMIAVLSLYLFTHSIWIYRLAFLYSSISISYFLVSYSSNLQSNFSSLDR